MAETPAGTSCVTCGAAVTGRYCAACGEELLDARKLTVAHFVTHSLIPELVNLDGRVWRTLRYLLFRPGRLALEYAAGRRKRYLKPLRVLLVAIVLYALSTQGGRTFTLNFGAGTPNLSLTPPSVPQERSIANTFLQIDRFGVLERMFAAKIGPVDEAPDEVRTRFNRSLRGFATPVSFATVLSTALLLFVLFRRRRRLFVEHAVFTMHYFSFVLLISVLVMLAFEFELLGSFAAAILLILGMSVWQAAYLAIGLRRFYWHLDARRLVPWASAVGVGILVYVLNIVFLTTVQLLGGVIAIWRL